MLANPMRGEAQLGDQKLVVDFNRLCALEAATERTVPELVVMLRTGIGFGFREMRTMVRVFASESLNDDQAGDLISSSGMVEHAVPGKKKTEPTWAAAVAISEAFEGFFAKQKAANENPRKAA